MSRSLRRAVRSPPLQLCREGGIHSSTSLSLGALLTCLRGGGREHRREVENFSGTLPPSASSLHGTQGLAQRWEGERGTGSGSHLGPFWVLLLFSKREGESTAVFKSGEVVHGGREIETPQVTRTSLS